MAEGFDPGELWEAVEPFVQVGVERLGEDRSEMLNMERAGLAVVYNSDNGSARMVYYAPDDEGAVEMNQAGADSLPAEVAEQFDRFLQAGLARLDESTRRRVLDDVGEGGQLMAVLDLTERNLKGVITRGDKPGDLVELFTLALG